MNRRRTPQATLTGLALGALLVTGTGAAILASNATPAPARAASDTSTAFGVSASGVDAVNAQPSVSSAGAVKSASAGSVSGSAGTFTATGLSVKAGAGLAQASVSNVTVGGKSIGAVSATCANGHISYDHPDVKPQASNLNVDWEVSGAAAVITITGAGGKHVETITVAKVSCGAGTPPTSRPTSAPPTSRPPTSNPPAGKPTGRPAPIASPGQGSGNQSEQPAPSPKPKDGHHAVTG